MASIDRFYSIFSTQYALLMIFTVDISILTMPLRKLTSSSSYIVSVKKGMSSDLVRSTPNAKAIVDSFLMELSLS